MSICLPDYNNCTVNLACSILEEFGAKRPGHATLAAADRLLRKKHYKNIVVLLLDAMGQNIIEHNLDENGFFRRHLVTNYSSVFPSTTAAATTSIDSALCPSEHGWLGWNCYFPEIDRMVTVLLNRDSITGEPIEDCHVAKTYCPYQTVAERIQETGAGAYISMPYATPYPGTFPEVCERIQELCALNGRKYIYAYWDEPDTTLHATGCYSEDSRAVLRTLEGKVQAMCEKLAGTDTILFVTADHGHMDSTNLVLTDYPDLMECLSRPPFIEARATGFFVKPKSKDKFPTIFQSHFGDSFKLMSKSEVIASGLFGPTVSKNRLDKMLGDYLAISVSQFSLYQTPEKAARHIGTHAGLTKEEMRIPLICLLY
ncbi:MAG: alkaline phosphatase family protein [Lachnospiraceae bacterium]|nr:alkaline phosphatase family protein [Lachnospiraceae bacterium]